MLVVLLGVATTSQAVAQGPGRPADQQAPVAGNYNPQYDVNHDGAVTVQDLQLVAGSWLSSGSPTIIGQGPDYGGIFTATNSSGIGLRATVNNGSGNDPPTTTGVWGDTDSGAGVFGITNSGHGVYGWAVGTSGVNIGVYGQSNSPAGFGTIGENVAGGVGVKGISSDGGAGVLGTSLSGSGVRGQHGSGSGFGTYIGGVVGDADSTGYGVVGLSSGSPGVRGTSDTSTGVEAVSSSGIGVSGTSASNHGVSATSGGTGTPGAALAANANGSSGIAIYGMSTSSDATLVVANTGSGDLIRAFGTSTGGNLRFKVDQAGNVRADGSYSTPAADFAELLPAAEGLSPGDVLAISPDGRLTRSTQAYQTTVAGVFSSQPGFLGGFKEGDKGKVPLALVGVVPVKVSAENGAIQAGDLLVSSATPGHAMRCEERGKCIGAIIGKALARLDKSLGVIQVLITLQ